MPDRPVGADDHRHGEALAEEHGRLVAVGCAVERRRQELPVGERGLVADPRDLVFGAAVAEIEDHTRQAPPRQSPQRFDAVPLPLQTASIQNPFLPLAARQIYWTAGALGQSPPR
jgi:hypothetical protein